LLNSDTKRHIDAARDVLVGVAPNPTTQIDQITYALIYKFMDDMDQASVKAGGEASFFVGDLEKYAWSNLMSTRMGNQEKTDLYSEALTKFSEAKQLPELFRTIFRAAFLPYRSPETLGLFLKEISHFDYTHPEELGNAYEYLLSIMSSQGDAGQFRTPRHIIDFIVDVVNPTKDDKVLDPACGTGGFLVSTYNHILEQHDGRDDPKKKEKPLTPDERKKLMSNLQGYDIDPTMVRIAQVNMYLHQFKNPQIYQYDSLTSEERWNDKYDVILANPPFMTPKGGIKPHNKFGVSSNRAEVLFVDYIMNHLKPKGRAGIVVPEGIIFQSGKAYKELRKNLVENGLYAVVSLPSGVFQPYSGVKTSILFLDNEVSKQKLEVAFVRIEADGFDLGASKRITSRNDLPHALASLNSWALGETTDNPILSLVDKKEIATKDYNLSGERYKVGADYSKISWPVVTLEEIAIVKKGSSITQKDTSIGTIPVIAGGQKPAYFHNVSNREGNVITVSASGAYAGFVNYFDAPIFASDCSTIQSKDESHALTRYLYLILKGLQEVIYKFQQGGGQPHVYPKDLVTIEVPLPPLDVQVQIVAELDAYAAIIDGAKQIVDNWKPKIEVDPVWEKRELGDVCEVYQPKTITGAEILEDGPFKVYGANGVIGYYDKFNHPDAEVAITCRGATCGTVNFTEPESWITGNAMVVSPKDKTLSKKFLQYLLIGTDLNSVITGSAQPQITGASLKPFEIPVPPIATQEEIVELIDREAALVSSAKQLIEVYETRTKIVIDKLWLAEGEIK
jgi:type I restriction enzyme M protein